MIVYIPTFLITFVCTWYATNFKEKFNISTFPESFSTFIGTEKRSEVFIAPEMKFIEANTGDVTEIFSPSLTTPDVCIKHVDVRGTLNSSWRYERII